MNLILIGFTTVYPTKIDLNCNLIPQKYPQPVGTAWIFSDFLGSAVLGSGLASIRGRQVDAAIFAHGAHVELPAAVNETWKQCQYQSLGSETDHTFHDFSGGISGAYLCICTQRAALQLYSFSFPWPVSQTSPPQSRFPSIFSMPRLKTTPLEFCPNFSKSCINCAPNNGDEARWSCLMVDRLLSHIHSHYVNYV